MKRIAENIPGNNFVRIDLKEYHSSMDLNKLIGVNSGYVGYNDEHLLSTLKNNNFSIILFDNYQAAHQSVKELIKEILKEGYIRDNKGDKIYFNNSFIFITDDVLPNRKVGFSNELSSQRENELEDLVDATIKFSSLTKDGLEKYLKIKKVLNKDTIIEKSNYEQVGYKNLEKLIRNNNLVEN